MKIRRPNTGFIFRCKDCKFLWTAQQIVKKCPDCGSENIKEK